MKWLFVLFASFAFAQSSVTYELSGGRLGDNLLAYLHGKWVAYKYDLPFLYVPFDYSSCLVLSEKEERFNPDASFPETVLIEGNLGVCSSRRSALYVVPYFPEDPHERIAGRSHRGLPFRCFSVDWQDPLFRKMAREMIAPLQPIRTLDLPKDRITIAIHVRHGGRHDPTTHGRYYPLKFPEISFYVKGLSKLLNMFHRKPIYCYLFTDSTNRAEIAKAFKDVLFYHPNAVLEYRDPATDYEELVLEDFFSLFKFDAIIRPYSNFSVVPTLIHDYAVIYSPKTFIHRRSDALIQNVDVIVNEPLYRRLLQEF